MANINYNSAYSVIFTDLNEMFMNYELIELRTYVISRNLFIKCC